MASHEERFRLDDARDNGRSLGWQPDSQQQRGLLVRRAEERSNHDQQQLQTWIHSDRIPEGFVPTKTLPFSKETYLESIPEDSKIRGVFLNGLIQMARSRGIEASSGVRFPLSYMGVRTFIEEGFKIMSWLDPDADEKTRLRRVGQSLFPSWAASALGKPFLEAVASTPYGVVSLTEPGCRVSFSHIVIECIARIPNGALLNYRDMHLDVGTVFDGLMEGFIGTFGLAYDSVVMPYTRDSGDLLIRWSDP